jgi:hypothetical protein
MENKESLPSEAESSEQEEWDELAASVPENKFKAFWGQVIADMAKLAEKPE